MHSSRKVRKDTWLLVLKSPNSQSYSKKVSLESPRDWYGHFSSFINVTGFESEALTYCVTPFLGVFTYVHTSAASTCGLNQGDSLLDVCNSNRTNLIFDYNLCPTQVAFSGIVY